MIKTHSFKVNAHGKCELTNITDRIEGFLKQSGLKEGSALVFSQHTTACIIIMEHEPGLIKDTKDFFSRIIPDDDYHHNRLNNDDNGKSHLAATLLNQSLTVPFIDGKLALGRWQSIVFADFDTKPRERSIIVQLNGEHGRN
jgi:secondary thiamine-phosphate synthase enzyme